jgi:hypothetical protein
MISMPIAEWNGKKGIEEFFYYTIRISNSLIEKLSKTFFREIDRIDRIDRDKIDRDREERTGPRLGSLEPSGGIA